MDKPEIIESSTKFTQEGNTLGTTSESEEIQISLEFQLSEKDGPFYVIKTNGWSFDDVSDLNDLIKRASKVLEKKVVKTK